MATATQKALLVTEIGKPLTLGTRPIPTPDSGEVLVKVTSTQVLFHDLIARDVGLFIQNHLPAVLGHGIAGTIVALGPNVTKYTIGQHIFGMGDPLAPSTDYSGLQAYALLATNMSALVPDGFSDDQMVTLPLNGNTIFTALFHENWLGFPAPGSKEGVRYDYKGQKLVIVGGGSNCGKLAVQWARLVGIGTIIVTASMSSEEELRSLGAMHVLDRHSKTIVRDVQEICGGKEEVTHVLDAVSYDYEPLLEMVATNRPSSIVIVHTYDLNSELKKRGKNLAKGSVVAGWKNNFNDEMGKLYWDNLGRWVQDVTVQIPKYRVIEGLDANLVNEALDSYRDQGRVVHAVIHP